MRCYLVVAVKPDQHHPRKLALACVLRGFQASIGRSRRIGPTSGSKLGGNMTFPRRMRHPLANGVARDLFAEPSSTTRNEQMTSFHVLGTRLGPVISLASPVFLCSAKEAVSPPRPSSCQEPCESDGQ